MRLSEIVKNKKREEFAKKAKEYTKDERDGAHAIEIHDFHRVRSDLIILLERGALEWQFFTITFKAFLRKTTSLKSWPTNWVGRFIFFSEL